MSLSKFSVPQVIKQHHLLITVFLSLSILLSGCTSDSNSTESSTTQTGSAAAQSSDSASDTEIITVSATIFPAYDIARQIAGDKANVSLLLAPGESPHTFNMTPSIQKQISDSVLVFGIGEGLDEWIVDSDNFIILSSGIKLRGWDDEDDHDDHDDDKHKEDDDHDDDDHDDHDDKKHDDDDDHDDHDHDDEKHDDDDDHDDHDDKKHDDDDDHDDKKHDDDDD
ncbi:MAG: metal ABC transporter substrate-binding protein, partial [Dehalococcoidia bacterium]|nr:metal ABC transporter substrate-binding protein [Dehalococcoidia bacterium]